MLREMNARADKTRILILGGGFAGVEAARYLDRKAAKRSDVEVTLVSRDNFSLFTPMLHEVVASEPRERGKVVLHWFTGSTSEARRAVGLGCCFSVNTQMVRNDRGRKLVEALPSDRLLTETDAPFTRVQNRSSVPSDVKASVEELANLRQQTRESMATMIVANLRTLALESVRFPGGGRAPIGCDVPPGPV
jgi:TatD DNase family protein